LSVIQLCYDLGNHGSVGTGRAKTAPILGEIYYQSRRLCTRICPAATCWTLPLLTTLGDRPGEISANARKVKNSFDLALTDR
jgi:hypothetical protein